MAQDYQKKDNTAGVDQSLRVSELERELEKARENTAQLVAGLNEAVFIVARSGLVLFSNLEGCGPHDRCCDLDGCLPGGRAILQRHQDGGTAFQKTPTTEDNRCRMRGKDGDYIPVEVKARDILWDGQQAWLVQCRDISQRLVMEKERERLFTAIEQIADAVLITNSSGLIQYTNPAFTAITGYSAEDVLGATPRILRSGRQEPAFYRDMWETLGRGEIWQGRLYNRRKDGSEYLEEATISPVRDGSGVITHYVGVKRDITHEERQEELRRQTQKLEAIGTLAGGIAHDFNNILYAMMGNAHLAQDDIDGTHPAHEPLTEIVKAGDRGANLVSQMLTFGQRSDGQQQVLPLQPIISEAMDLVRASLPATIEIRLDLPRTAPCAMVDETQIHQVILNLCSNASHAMVDQRGVLSLSLSEIDETTPWAGPDLPEGHHILLEFSDTGQGMEPEVLARIFEPYFTTRKANEGTGLGLASVHGIIHNHGGTISAESMPGEGTTFRLTFPVVGGHPRVGQVKEGPEESYRGQGRILVVDDEKMIVDVVGKGLRKAGFDVDTFEDGVEALEVFRRDPWAYDAVLTDQTMPNITGFELASQMSSLRPDLPIVLSTGYINPVDEEELKSAGIAQFLTKPLRIKELVKVLGELETTVITGKGN